MGKALTREHKFGVISSSTVARSSLVAVSSFC